MNTSNKAPYQNTGNVKRMRERFTRPNNKIERNRSRTLLVSRGRLHKTVSRNLGRGSKSLSVREQALRTKLIRFDKPPSRRGVSNSQPSDQHNRTMSETPTPSKRTDSHGIAVKADNGSDDKNIQKDCTPGRKTTPSETTNSIDAVNKENDKLSGVDTSQVHEKTASEKGISSSETDDSVDSQSEQSVPELSEEDSDSECEDFIEEMHELLKTEEKSYDSGVLIFGNTGAGKSTLTNLVSGKVRLTVVENDEEELCFDVEDNSQAQAKIGFSSTTSETEEPNEVQLKSTTLFDCPGLFDSKGWKMQIKVAAHMYKIARKVKKIKLVLVVSAEDSGCRYQSIKKFFENISGMFKCVQEAPLTSLYKNTVIIISKMKGIKIPKTIHEIAKEYLSKHISYKNIISFGCPKYYKLKIGDTLGLKNTPELMEALEGDRFTASTNPEMVLPDEAELAMRRIACKCEAEHAKRSQRACSVINYGIKHLKYGQLQKLYDKIAKHEVHYGEYEDFFTKKDPRTIATYKTLHRLQRSVQFLKFVRSMHCIDVTTSEQQIECSQKELTDIVRRITELELKIRRVKKELRNIDKETKGQDKNLSDRLSNLRRKIKESEIDKHKKEQQARTLEGEIEAYKKQVLVLEDIEKSNRSDLSMVVGAFLKKCHASKTGLFGSIVKKYSHKVATKKDNKKRLKEFKEVVMNKMNMKKDTSASLDGLKSIISVTKIIVAQKEAERIKTLKDLEEKKTNIQVLLKNLREQQEGCFNNVEKASGV